MKDLLKTVSAKFDAVAEASIRRSAFRTSRRGFVARLGQAVVGTALLPTLPYDRFGEAQAATLDDQRQSGDEAFDQPDQQCDYWRYCALSGTLCTCCGGSTSQCPPGTEISKVSWVGTCENPDDNKSYLITYNDCCGKMACTGCRCSNHERERPGYRLGLHNGINWCMANNKNAYHCTVAAVVGTA